MLLVKRVRPSPGVPAITPVAEDKITTKLRKTHNGRRDSLPIQFLRFGIARGSCITAKLYSGMHGKSPVYITYGNYSPLTPQAALINYSAPSPPLSHPLKGSAP